MYVHSIAKRVENFQGDAVFILPEVTYLAQQNELI